MSNRTQQLANIVTALQSRKLLQRTARVLTRTLPSTPRTYLNATHLGILVLVEVGDDNVSALACVRKRHRPANTTARQRAVLPYGYVKAH